MSPHSHPHDQQAPAPESSAEGRVRELEAELAKLRRDGEREAERRQIEKLESLGRLAGGLAHEINTPLQFIGDNLSFLSESYATLTQLAARHRAIHRELAESKLTPAEALARADEAERIADLSWLEQNVPPALTECGEGLQHVREIVRAMKEFSRPQGRDRHDCDVNEAMVRALVVARGEYQSVADVESDLGEVPRASCSLDDLHQVLFNLIVNAAQAITDRAPGRRGVIRVATRHRDDQVVITVSDDGCGIPEHVQPRIFEHFFTTREVGRGTGQGLALAWSLVAQKHGGVLRFESEVGRGTTFEVRLPALGSAQQVAAG